MGTTDESSLSTGGRRFVGAIWVGGRGLMGENREQQQGTVERWNGQVEGSAWMESSRLLLSIACLHRLALMPLISCDAMRCDGALRSLAPEYGFE